MSISPEGGKSPHSDGYRFAYFSWEQPTYVTLLVTGVPLGATAAIVCDHWHALFCAQSGMGQVMIVRGPDGSVCDPRRLGLPPHVGFTEIFTEAELLHEVSLLISEGMVPSGDH